MFTNVRFSSPLPSLRAMAAAVYLALVAAGAGCEVAGSGDDASGAGDDAGAADAAPNDGTAPETASDSSDPAIAADTSASASANDAAGAHADALAPLAGFEQVVHEVIGANGCAGGYCHGPSLAAGDGAPGGAGFATLRAMLLTAQSATPGCATPRWIVPGAPLQSLLYRKVAPGVSVSGCGDKMPPSSAGVTPAQAATLRAWIEAGAH